MQNKQDNDKMEDTPTPNLSVNLNQIRERLSLNRNTTKPTVNIPTNLPQVSIHNSTALPTPTPDPRTQQQYPPVNYFGMGQVTTTVVIPTDPNKWPDPPTIDEPEKNYDTLFSYVCSPGDYLELLTLLMKNLVLDNVYIDKLKKYVSDPSDEAESRKDILDNFDYAELFENIRVSKGLIDIVLSFRDGNNMKQILFYKIVKAIETKNITPEYTYDIKTQTIPANSYFNFEGSRLTPAVYDQQQEAMAPFLNLFKYTVAQLVLIKYDITNTYRVTCSLLTSVSDLYSQRGFGNLKFNYIMYDNDKYYNSKSLISKDICLDYLATFNVNILKVLLCYSNNSLSKMYNWTNFYNDFWSKNIKETKYFEDSHHVLFKNCNNYTIFDIFESKMMIDVVKTTDLKSDYMSYEYYVNNKMDFMDLVRFMHFASENEDRYSQLNALFKKYFKSYLQDLATVISMCFARNIKPNTNEQANISKRLSIVLNRILNLEEVQKQFKFENVTVLLRLLTFNSDSRELFGLSAESLFRSNLATKFEKLKTSMHKSLKARSEYILRSNLGVQSGEYDINSHRLFLEISLTKLYHLRDCLFYYKFQMESDYASESLKTVLKSIAIIKKELELIVEGKSVLIENSVDNAIFKHPMEQTIPMTEYKILRQDNKDVLILD
eukprot:Mrub_01425.p1 GENE.Mrub_01425~~Mrub_01425.p1  ORF type:complete len:661 (-),score=129.49 Mrub_01425:30-2012(-)